MNKTMLKSATVVVMALAAAFAAADDIKVTVDGTPVVFDGAQPQMINGRVMVPLRGVFEQMGDNVNWQPDNQTVFAAGNGRHVQLQIGSYDATVDHHLVTMDVMPQIIDDTTMVPLRFLSQSLGASVDWQPDNDLVAITTHARPQRITPPTPPPTIVTPPPTVIIEKPAPPPPVIIEKPAPPPPPPAMYNFRHDTVIPLVLDQNLASNKSHDGEHFEMTVQQGYGDVPPGTVVVGVIRSAISAGGDHAGSLDVRFTEFRFPDGHGYPLEGFVTPLSNRNIVESQGGRLFLRANGDQYMPQEPEVREGAWLVIGNQRGKIVGGAALGGTFGSIVGAFDHSVSRNVIINQGTQFALVLNHGLTVEQRDLR